ncbi:hypothetical protein ACIGW3_08280 [Streptomyces sp. NPDC053499]|uniref:hypothetical protein n=1 Tax=Streptomyces sp. NPDC053499 TaxID=3365707 RepID=UPI0037CD19DC
MTTALMMCARAMGMTSMHITPIHGVVVGAVAKPMMGRVHPRMRGSADGFSLEGPGFMRVGYGKGTPMGHLLMGHLLHGSSWWGRVYGVLV